MTEKIKAIIFYIIFFIFILALGSTAEFYDYDLWARLIVGMHFLQTGSVSRQDFLSYTPTHLWFDHEWGSGVIFYLTQQIFPVMGFLLLQTIIFFLTFFFITKIVKLRGLKTTHAYNFWFYYFAIISMSYYFNDPVRSQIFTFLFFTIFLYILERSKNGIGKNIELTLLPLIMIIWCNLHGGCTAGLGLIVLYIIGEILDKKSIKKYLLTLLVTTLATCISPWGYHYLFLLAADTATPRNLITEWISIFAHNNFWDFLEFKLFVAVLLTVELGISIKRLISENLKVDKTAFLILITTLFLATKHIKLIPFAVISITCFLYDDFYTVFNYITRNLFNKVATSKDILTYFIVLVFSISVIKQNGFGPYQNWLTYPIKAVEFIKINNLKGKVLQDFTYGSYISYKLYPHNKIFMDGRFSGVYDYNLLYELENFHLGKKGWESLLKKYPSDIILQGKTQRIFPLLKNRKEWKIAYEDEIFAVFVKKQDFRISYKMPSNDLNHYKKTLFDTDVNFVLQSKHEHKK